MRSKAEKFVALSVVNQSMSDTNGDFLKLSAWSGAGVGEEEGGQRPILPIQSHQAFTGPLALPRSISWGELPLN